MGISIGGPTALQFALLTPRQVLSADNGISDKPRYPDFDVLGNIMHHVVFRSDIGV